MDRGRERRIINERGKVGKEKEEQRHMDPGGERMNVAGKSCGRDVCWGEV